MKTGVFFCHFVVLCFFLHDNHLENIGITTHLLPKQLMIILIGKNWSTILEGGENKGGPGFTITTTFRGI
ncbi:hypothetical protein DX926_19860 [Bacillus atrophaeus]|nr:hypothetical protein DX926_19860 [Bacillus atrophaeus]